MRLSSTDTTFAEKFAQSGMAEIALAKVAVMRSKDPKIVAFAKKMITDHTKAGDQLMAIASAQSISLPQTVTPAQAAMKTALVNAPASEFDSLFRKDNATGHAQALTLLKTEMTSGNDPKLKKYAQMTEPTVEEHIKLVGTLPMSSM